MSTIALVVARPAAAGPPNCSTPTGGFKAANAEWIIDWTFLTYPAVNCKYHHMHGNYLGIKAYAQQKVNGTVWGASPNVCRNDMWSGLRTPGGNNYGSPVTTPNWNTWVSVPGANVPNWTGIWSSCFDNWMLIEGWRVS